jgi:hypothetical protein
MTILAHAQLDPSAAIMINLPIIVKGQEDSFGRRMISIEASSEACDLEGDVIEQKALLDAAPDFIKNGHCDWSHYSELHARLGLTGSPSDWIIGSPREVVDLGDGRTGVIAELRQSTDGSFDPHTRVYDAIWRDLSMVAPAVKYRASIYGFPKAGMIEDCRKATCNSTATRYHIKGLDWKSLALTTNPVNDSLTGFARVVTAKSFIELIKSSKSDTAPFPLPAQMAPPTQRPYPRTPLPADEKAYGAGPDAGSAPLGVAPSFPVPMPKSLSDAVGQFHHHMGKCAYTAGIKSVAGFKGHFTLCCGMDEPSAELYSHALMYALLLHGRRG